ncbi:MAG: metallophosphoesterase, partial [Chloroflexi bacterium]|nr:metallophosphoesterase [Chloroflexota bacterium]
MYTILHISDLHRSTKDHISNNELLMSLLNDFDRSAQETPPVRRPDGIIVSGDIVQGLPAGASEYPQGLERQYEE